MSQKRAAVIAGAVTTLLPIGVGVGSHAVAGPATIRWIEPPIPGGSLGVHAMSDDGGVVLINTGIYPPNPEEGFYRWTRRGQERLAMPDGRSLNGYAATLSGDGRVVLSVDGGSCVRWIDGRFERLCSTPFVPFGHFWAANYDGSVWYYSLSRYEYRWTNYRQQVARSLHGQIANLGDLGYAVQALSDDGWSGIGTVGTMWGLWGGVAARIDLWTGLATPLPLPAGIAFGAGTARSISGDGRIIVGEWGNSVDATTHAFVWSADRPDQTRLLASPVFATGWAAAHAVSRDGSRIVGSVSRPESFRSAVLWGDGVPWDLGSYLLSRGVRFEPGDLLFDAVAISTDGRVVAGHAWHANRRYAGYVATLGSACPADMDNGTGYGIPDDAVTIDDLMYYLGEYASGSVFADVDDGSGGGVGDRAVTIDDLLYYLERYATGC